jgi:hypothetical protein
MGHKEQKGISMAGNDARQGQMVRVHGSPGVDTLPARTRVARAREQWSKKRHQGVLNEMQQMPKPNLPKSEESEYIKPRGRDVHSGAKQQLEQSIHNLKNRFPMGIKSIDDEHEAKLKNLQDLHARQYPKTTEKAEEYNVTDPTLGVPYAKVKYPATSFNKAEEAVNKSTNSVKKYLNRKGK